MYWTYWDFSIDFSTLRYILLIWKNAYIVLKIYYIAVSPHHMRRKENVYISWSGYSLNIHFTLLIMSNFDALLLVVFLCINPVLIYPALLVQLFYAHFLSLWSLFRLSFRLTFCYCLGLSHSRSWSRLGATSSSTMNTTVQISTESRPSLSHDTEKAFQVCSLSLENYQHEEIYEKVNQTLHLNSPLRNIGETQCRTLV